MSLLKWIVESVRERAGGEQGVLGWMPRKQDLELEGLGLSDSDFAELMKISPSEWVCELEAREKFFSEFGSKLPPEFEKEQARILDRLGLGDSAPADTDVARLG